MYYNTFEDLELSGLGMGTMRLPLIGEKEGDIDEAAARGMIRQCMDAGINYYDTAWGYHDGNSEKVVGKILSEYPRDKFYLASKFPGYDLENMPKIKEIFPEQLKKCRVDYFDFYLFHNVCEMNIDQYLSPRYGIHHYIMKQKKAGKIRHVGFSCHGALPILKRFLEAYGKDMEFCQLQLNWFDWEFQDGREKVELLKEYGIPVWVMEPLRGGKLCTLEPEYESILKKLEPQYDNAEWAFRFLQSEPEVKMILSGMSGPEQVTENIALFEERKPLTTEDREELLKIGRDMRKSRALPCTACHYCTVGCPKKLDIPQLLALYNEHVVSGGGFIAPMALEAIPKNKWPNMCIGCRSCERLCPQQLKISEAMTDFSRLLGLKQVEKV